MIVAALLLQAGVVPAQAANPDICDSPTTPDINACAGRELAAAEAIRRRYADAARKRIRAEVAQATPGSMSAGTLAAFERAESAWAAYRDAECNAVYANWSDGTIRTLMGLSCSAELTRLRTHAIWQDWLTYEDSTPPLLPEPPLEETK